MRIDEAQDVKSVQRIIDRAQAIKRRTEQLDRVIALHADRAPPELLPKVLRAIGVRAH